METSHFRLDMFTHAENMALSVIISRTYKYRTLIVSLKWPIMC